MMDALNMPRMHRKSHDAIIPDLVAANRQWNNLNDTRTRIIAACNSVANIPGIYEAAAKIDELIGARMQEFWDMSEECERELEALARDRDEATGSEVEP